jgi:ribonuclease VapC
MVIDTSAATAILRNEPDARAFAEAIRDAPTRLMSAVSVLEAGIVAQRSKGGPGVQRLDVLAPRS